jgi:hypothetical protein
MDLSPTHRRTLTEDLWLAVISTGLLLIVLNV